jgi:hypothetical protein
MKVATIGPKLSNNIFTHDITRKVTKPKDVLLCPIELKQVTITTSLHCTTNNECLYLQMKKYKIKT